MNIYKNNNLEITIIQNSLYIKFTDLININNKDIEYIVSLYNILHIVCFENNIKFDMVLDLYETNINLNFIYNHSTILIDTLEKIKPISNINIKKTFLIISNFSKNLINIILQFYKPGKPLYIISNLVDIKNLVISTKPS